MYNCKRIFFLITEDKKKLKQTKNLFNALTRSENSVFYGADRIKKKKINNANKVWLSKG